CAPAEREIPDTDVSQKTDAIANLAQHAFSDPLFAFRKFDALENRQRLGYRKIHVVAEAAAFDADGATLGPQTIAVARRARPQRAIRFQAFLIAPRSFEKSPAQIGNHAFEVRTERVSRRFRLALASGRRRIRLSL